MRLNWLLTAVVLTSFWVGFLAATLLSTWQIGSVLDDVDRAGFGVCVKAAT